MGNKIRKRVSAVIIRNNKILLIKRVKPGLVYFTFPGGGIEEDENIEQTLKREVKEELTLDIKEWRLLFELENQYEDAYNNMHKGNQHEYFFTIIKYNGIPKIGGSEKERMNEQNQYHLEWMELSVIRELNNLYPQEAVKKLLEFLRTKE